MSRRTWWWVLMAIAAVPTAYAYPSLPLWGGLLLIGVLGTTAQAISFANSQPGSPGNVLFGLYVWLTVLTTVVTLSLWMARAVSIWMALSWWLGLLGLITFVTWVVWNFVGRPQ